jgi:molybdopterin molybdotransferase
MISLDEAQARLLALATPVATETIAIAIAQATGRWLADDALARRTQPARDLSAMDGYAVRAGDGPEWRVIGESAAGRNFAGGIGIGEAVRIFTGAALPAGADSVIIQENVARDGDAIRQSDGNPPQSGDHVRFAGSDFAAGDLLVAKGTQLSAADIGLLVAGGYGSIAVARPIQVTLISTGDELVPPGASPGDDQLPASNGVMLAAMLHGWPVELRDPGIVPDRLEAVQEAISAAQDSDIIVTIGGASVGDHDLVKPALEAAGAKLDFWKVAMRPGKPVLVGQLGNAITLGLPGNPVSAFVTAILFLKPLIAALSGASAPMPMRESATLGGALPACGPRTDHVRGRFENGRIVPVGPNDSAALKGLARAEALIVRAPDAPPAAPGDIVDIIRTS